jgi:protein-tyrosine phosphatase
MEDALKLCRALVVEGIATVVATPHQLGRYDGRNDGSQVRDAVDVLTVALAEHSIPLEVLGGGEVRIDERIPAMLRGGQVLTLAGGDYLLLELPESGYLDPLPLIRFLGRGGITAIIAHVERYREVQKRLEIVNPWIEAGAALQINAGSLTGNFGRDAERTSWHLIDQEFRLLVATDAHDIRARPPQLSHAAELIERRFGVDTAVRTCIENPWQILRRPLDSGPQPQVRVDSLGQP